MLGFLKRKSPKDRLEKKYQDLMAEAHRLSTSDRRAADDKLAEAQKVLEEIESLEA